MTLQTEFDHLVVAADTLERGIDHVEHCLGVRCTAGGHHPKLGTHNALLGLGHDRYIEVIAIDPGAGTPAMPRWFGLDDPAVQAALSEQPRLLTWVARSRDLDAAVAACMHDPGRPRPMQRDDLHWRIAFPDDGALLEDGLLPLLIEWGDGRHHPARRLPDTGLRLRALHGVHPDPKRVRERLVPLALNDSVALEAGGAGEAAHLQAEIETPDGLRWLH